MKRLLSATLLVASVLLATTHLAAFTGGYSIGINFGSAEPDGANQGGLAATDAAGIDTAVQANWNNFPDGTQATAQSLVADDEGARITTSATVTWVSTLTWSSTGRGEENNQFPAGPDRTLMLGYLDTANSSTTAVTIQNIPTDLTSSGYNVIVYALGGVVNRGGSYRVLSDPSTPLSDYKLVSSPANPTTYIEDTGESHAAAGNYVVFNGLSSSTLIVEATTTVNPLDGTPRAPINAIQLVQIGGEVRPVIRPATANAAGFTVFADDIGAAVVDPATVTTVLDGASVTPTVSKVGSRTTIRYSIFTGQNTFFESGSQHSLVVTLRDTQGAETVANQNFTVAPYATIPAGYALAAPATVPGMVVSRVFQTASARTPGAAANNTPSAEQHLLGGMVDLAGTVLPNIAENAGPINISGESDGSLWWTANANWEQNAGDITTAPPFPDNFNSAEPAGSGGLFSNEYPPGVLLGDDPDNFVLETIAYVQLTRGLHRWGVNSDDGFKVTAAPGQPSVLGVTLGEFNTGRGAADTLFDFVAEADGYYPIRLLWWEGNGGANCEWFSVNIDTGERFLIGDVTSPASYDAFRTGQGRARVQSILPAPGYVGAVTQPTIRIELANGRTSYVAGSAKLAFDGVPVTPAINGTVITYAVPAPLVRDTTHTVEFSWDENTTPVTSWTNNWSFTIAPFTPADMPADSFWIEIEDFNHSGGQTVAAASTMPYAGGAYNGLLATLNVDYFDDQNDDLVANPGIDVVYRGNRLPNHANITVHTGIENLGTARPAGFVATTNFRLGWAGNFWGNYTRTMPQGVYRAYAALSSDNAANILQAPLDKVTAGAGTTTQTLERVGVFYGNGATTWGGSILVPLRTSASLTAPLGAFKHTGGPVTLRFSAVGGDADWFVFVPATDVPPTMTPSLSSPSVSLTQMPYGDLSVPADVVLSWRLEDQSTEVDPATIKLMFDGADVSAGLTVNKQGTVTTVTYDPPSLLELGQSYAYEFSFRATEVPQLQSDSGTLVVNYIPNTPAGAFLIEAEDFNTDGGDYLPVVDTMPYLGNAYNGLAAVEGIDYQRSSVVADGNVYRLGETNNVPMGANTDTNTYDLVRSINGGGTWQVTANYSCGWSGVGNWLNYTRNIPASTYQIWAGMSSDRGAQADGMVASLDRVVGSAAVSNQVVQAIGTFQSAGTRGWGNTSLVPLRDGGQQIAEVALSGVTTLRVNMNYGDVDYLMLIPTGGRGAADRLDRDQREREHHGDVDRQRGAGIGALGDRPMDCG